MKSAAVAVLALAFLASAALAEVYFQENFTEGNWEDRWVQSQHKSDYGKLVLSAGKYYGDAETAKGLKTSQDARFYAHSTKFNKFSNKGKDLVIQFSVKHEQNIDCGGGYIKLFPSTLDQKDMHGDSNYNIMFGPDICGPSVRKVHTIFNYKGKNLENKKSISCKADEGNHLYTLIVHPDNTYEVRIDGDKVESGSLLDDFTYLLPRKINDPSVSKPTDWVDEKTIADVNDKKPADWDQPEHVADPDARKPEDWDDEMDGEWEPPQVDNPEYKGEWKPRQIPNPEYKGEWVHPQIDNPDFVDDKEVYAYSDFGNLGLDLWQVKSGTIFDNFLITDSLETAEAAVAAFKKQVEGENAAKKADEDKKAAEAKKEADAMKAADEEEEEDVKDEL